MQWQQNRTRECVHVITDLEKKNDGKKREKGRGRTKTSTSEIMYIKKDSTRRKV